MFKPFPSFNFMSTICSWICSGLCLWQSNFYISLKTWWLPHPSNLSQVLVAAGQHHPTWSSMSPHAESVNWMNLGYGVQVPRRSSSCFVIIPEQRNLSPRKPVAGVCSGCDITLKNAGHQLPRHWAETFGESERQGRCKSKYSMKALLNYVAKNWGGLRKTDVLTNQSVN